MSVRRFMKPPVDRGLRSSIDSLATPSAVVRPDAGFSLIELLVGVVIMAEILVGVSILLNSSSKLAQAQTHVAEIQQSLRVGQSEITGFAKSAGIGGLPITRLNLPDGEPNAANPNYDLPGAFPRKGYAVSVINNYPVGPITKVLHSTSSVLGADEVVPGSDVLVLRGVFTTPVYYFDPPLDITPWLGTGGSSELLNAGADQEVVVPERVRIVGEEWEDYPQNFAALVEALTAAKAANRPEAFILRDTLNPNAYAIMEFDYQRTENTDLTPDDCEDVPESAGYVPECIKFLLRLDPDNEPGKTYGPLMFGTSLLPGLGGKSFTLSEGPPKVQAQFPSTIGSIGLLEEYRFYVRAEWAIPGDNTTRLTPVLSRARFLPGTDVQIDRVDLADNVIDLQIAVGIDTDAPGDDGYGEITDFGNSADELLFNAVNDTDSDSYKFPCTEVNDDPDTAEDETVTCSSYTWYDPEVEVHFLRINTLVQSRSAVAGYRSPVIGFVEDHSRGTSFHMLGRDYNYNDEVTYHRRWLQTVVELRNLL